MSTLFYNNPRLLILALGLIFVGGLTSYQVLPRMEDPQMVPRAANVNTRFPGADAERVETLVTEKIEDSLREIKHIKRLRTNSRTGISTISIELRDEVKEPDPIWSRIRDKINDTVPELPQGAFEPEFDQLDIKAYAMLVSVTWNPDSPPSYAILRRLAKELEDRIKSVSGTEKVDVFGDPTEQIYVEISPSKAAAIGLTTVDIAAQIQASDSKDAAGLLRSKNNSLIVDVDEELDSLQRLGRTPIQFGSEANSFVLLSDLASLSQGALDPPLALSDVDGKPSIVLGVMSRSNVLIDQWSQQVDAEIEAFRAPLDHGIKVEKIFSQNVYVEDRLVSLIFNLCVGAGAVFVVVLLMMGWRNATVVGLSLPLSAMMVLTGLRLLEIPIHQMSVTGLIIALGLLIDNAIVMVDAVSQQLNRGLSAVNAIRESVKHLGVPLLGSTLTTAFAFAPIALMPGPAGEFVGSIAVSVILAIASSLVLALTIVPTLAAYGWSYRAQPASTSESSRPRWYSVGVRIPALQSTYEAFLNWILKAPIRGVVVGSLFPILGFVAATQLKEQFFPPADRDQLYVELQLPMGSSIEKTRQVSQEIRSKMLEDERIERVHWFLGESGPAFYYNVIPRRKGTPRYGQAMVELSSAEDASELINRWQQTLNQSFPEAKILVRQLEQGPPFEAPVEFRLYGQDLDDLREAGELVRSILVANSDVIHTTTELSEPQPKINLEIDEERARLLGLDHGMIAQQLRGGMDGASGGSIIEGTEEIPVSVRLQEDRRQELDQLRSMEFVSALPPTNTATEYFRGIPLSSLSEMTLAPETAVLPRYNGQRMNEVKAYLRAGVLPSTVLEDFEERYEKRLLEKYGVEKKDLPFGATLLPAGITREAGGEAAERDDAVGKLMANVSILAVLMVATLVLSFRSFRLAGIILIVAVLSVGLGMGALWIFDFPRGFMAIVGTMGLIGVAINDSIVVLAAIRENAKAKTGDRKAISEVVMEASRHVLSTTLTTIAGFTPLILAGGGFWPPLAVAIAGGVSGATILALIFVPATYRMMVVPETIPFYRWLFPGGDAQQPIEAVPATIAD